jgi:hypothetical protein
VPGASFYFDFPSRIEPQRPHIPQCRSPAQADRGVDYLQINSTTAGCFTFRIERAANGE